MGIREKLVRLAEEVHDPCVTISLNTHRTHPDNQLDGILLKNLLNEAEKRIIEEYGKRPATDLLEKISEIKNGGIDINLNLDSLHIFLSDRTKEIIRLTWPTIENRVVIDNRFDIRTLIKASNRIYEYLILTLSQSEVRLYEAMNDTIIAEIDNDDFPVTDNPWYLQNGAERSNAKLIDDINKEFFNRIDKSVVKIAQERDMKCIVICVEENYSYLQSVADKPDIYIGHSPIDYNNMAPHQLAEQAWTVIEKNMHDERAKAIAEMKEAVANSNVITDLQEIYRAAVDGRGDMLIVYEEYSQPVSMTDDQSFSLSDDLTMPDIVSRIAWEVLSKKGKVYFTKQDEIKDLGDIVLKTRY